MLVFESSENGPEGNSAESEGHMAGRTRGFSLVPKPVPSRQRSSFYQQIVDEFVQSGESSVLVDATEKKAVTLVQGLRKAIEAEGLKNVGVVQRSAETYLVKE
jgi:hypothetical protein